MVTKTQRILDLLPGTFAAQPAHSPLQRLIGTFGAELQGAENTLAAILRAHWCRQADLGRDVFDDLPRIAALYGLTPQDGDDVEEFRRRLKRWVALILDGPATVRGLLRASSILTGLEIDDSDAAFDPWWTRGGDGALTTQTASRRDAGPLIFGFDRAIAEGADAAPASLTGIVIPPETLDPGATLLRLGIDGGAPVTIDLAGAIGAQAMVQAINDQTGQAAAMLDRGRLRLTSPTTGSASQLVLADGPGDAAPELLGLAPRVYTGAAATTAQITGLVDLSPGVDLTERRYLRLSVDGTHLAEVDCAGADPAATTLDEIAGAINTGLGLTLASHDGAALRLTSPTAGATSGITFQTPAAQDARADLFGDGATFAAGQDARPASLTGLPDLSGGVDLTEGGQLVIAIDAGEAAEVQCAGPEPGNTQLPDIIAAINGTLRAEVASTNGRNLILRGLVAGPAGALQIGQAETGDAALALLGLAARTARGALAVRATLRGKVDLPGGQSLAARPLLQIAQDGGPARIFDLSAAAAAGPLDTAALALAINAQEGAPLAGTMDGHLTLASHLDGAGGRVELVPIAVTQNRRFLSRVPIAEDAGMTVLGLLSATASSAPAGAAVLNGQVNLSRGVDLRSGRYLRVALDGHPAVDIDCAGPRPRNTTLQEVITAINGALGPGVAQASGDRLRLVSPNAGAQSRIALETPLAADAQPRLLGTGPQTANGSAARQVSFVGTRDLSAGVDLTAAAHLRLAIDGGAPVDIDCRGFDPAATTPDQIAVSINLALGVNVASHDGRHLLLTSPVRGAGSRLDILTPGDPDATETILGVPPGRSYVGTEAQPARIGGAADLSGGVDLGTARILRLGVDTAAPADIDCAALAADVTQATGAEIAAAINAALGQPVARIEADRLVLEAPAPGASSRLVLEQAAGADAAANLFGDTPREVSGQPARPAQITGAVDLRGGADLSARSVLRLAIDDALPLEIDLAGEVPGGTAADEITAAINAALPGTATIGGQGRLILTAPPGATLKVLPLRHFELLDYPAGAASDRRAGVRHGDALFPANAGPADVLFSASFTAPLGVASPGLADPGTGRELRLRGALGPDDTAQVTHDGNGLRVETRAGPAPRAFGVPLLPHLDHPEDTHRAMATGFSGRRGLLLSDTFGADIVELTEISHRASAPVVRLRPAEHIPPDLPDGVFAGQLDLSGAQPLLDAGAEHLTLAAQDAAAFAGLAGLPVAATGNRVGDTLFVSRLRALYDLLIDPGTPGAAEVFAAVVLDEGGTFGPLSVLSRLNQGPAPSAVVLARAVDQRQALTLPHGTNRRVFVDCLAARYDAAHFDESRFAGGPCHEQGIFDVSRFAETPRAKSTAVFAPVAGGAETDIQLDWAQHTPGRAQINLPLDMDARFGARFDQGRFALAGDAPETIAGLVTEPAGDDDLFTVRLKPGDTDSYLIDARAAAVIPIGFDPVTIPFARAVPLTGGTASQAARLFLSDPGLPGFIEIAARAPGTHGNHIAVTVCDSAPGIFDLVVAFDGARFENARARVNGPPLTGDVSDLNDPGPRGVQHLKAGGIDLVVTRDGTPPETQDC